MTRQLVHRTFFLATLARKGRKQPDDASVALSSPGARLLLGSSRAHSVPADSALAQSSTSQPHFSHAIHTGQSESLPDASWRGFAANVAAHGAGFSTSSGAPIKSTHHPFPALTFSASFSESGAGVHPDTNPTPTTALSAFTAGGSYTAVPGAPAAVSSRAAAGIPQQSLPLSPTAATAAAAAVAAASPSRSESFSSSAGPSPSPGGPCTYNEPKDGSFSGRVVQHDGSHAVHLLVSGSSARDYNLRMVRCHVRDELRFSPAPPSAGGQSAGGGAACGAGLASARGEDVSFATFMYRQVRDTVSATFLPAGYPDTTGQNYVRFMAWQGLHNTAMTANSVLASTFMLYAVGLGAGSIPTAGALNWVLKDGMGQLGTLLFGKTIAHNFDVHSKTWFFLSAVMLQAAAALELLTVLMPGHFLLMGSLANTLKGLAWMASGSTRSVFHLSFARDNNIADVTAKGTSQYIFASLVGTAGGALMCAAVGQSGAAAATCFGALAAATVGSAYLAVQAIPLSTLNATRLQLLVDAFLSSISPADDDSRRRRRRSRGNRRTDGRDDGDDRDDDDDDDVMDRSYRATTAATAAARGRGGGIGGEPFDVGDSDDDDDVVVGGVDGRRMGSWVKSRAGGDAGGGWEGGGGGGGGLAGRGAGGFGGREGERDRDPNGGMRRWPRPRAYRTVDRCYIGPSTHEYELMYDDSLDPQVPTPLELSPLDPPLPYFSGCADRLSPPITVGSRLEHIVEGNANLLVMLLTTYKYAHFMVVPRRGSLHVVLHERADPRDMVQAYLQACILRRRLRGDHRGAQPLPDPDERTAELRLELQESLAAAERLTTIFMSTIEANGWTVAKVVVEAQRRRARW